MNTLDTGTGVAPPRCGQGQPLSGVHRALLLPAAGSGKVSSRTIRCRTTARKIFIDAGTALISEDAEEPNWPLPPDGELVPFDRAHLNPICEDVVKNFLPAVGREPARVRVDGMRRKPVRVATRWFMSRITPVRPEYPASVELGHPGRLAFAACGYKAVARRLHVGMHIVKVNYTPFLNTEERIVFTYKVRVQRKRHQ